jgi:hypothetical protein
MNVSGAVREDGGISAAPSQSHSACSEDQTVDTGDGRFHSVEPSILASTPTSFLASSTRTAFIQRNSYTRQIREVASNRVSARCLFDVSSEMEVDVDVPITPNPFDSFDSHSDESESDEDSPPAVIAETSNSPVAAFKAKYNALRAELHRLVIEQNVRDTCTCVSMHSRTLHMYVTYVCMYVRHMLQNKQNLKEISNTKFCFQLCVAVASKCDRR